MNSRHTKYSTIIACVVLCVGLFTGCTGANPYVWNTFLLDTTISITSYYRFSSAFIETLFDYIADVEQRMSTHATERESSELLRLNRFAGITPVQVSQDTFQLIEMAINYSKITSGSFDVTIWPLTHLWSDDLLEQRGGIPTEQETARATSLVNQRYLLRYPHSSVYLSKAHMGIDVGGIAKGWAADRVTEQIKEEGAAGVLLDFGGNIVLIGNKPDNTNWKIGIQDPNAVQGTYLGVVASGPAAIVTSGDYERFYEHQGKKYHHIIDPATGYPVENSLRSVTIIAQEALHADVLSTAVFVLGKKEGMELVESLPNTEAILVTKSNTVVISSGIGESFNLTAHQYTIQKYH